MSNHSQVTYAMAINQAIEQAMYDDPFTICYGLGVTDPKGVFGTTLGLDEKFGSNRVFDMPTSENAMTGVAIGAALAGIRSVVTHQRVDFFLLALDQLINGAAKWHYMFGGQFTVPITIRLIIGRGWGQGPTHSQNLQALFAHIPGLKVLMPTSPQDAKSLLYSAIFDPNPVVFLEHRWLHNAIGNVDQRAERVSLEKARVVREGKDCTVLAMSYLTVEAQRAIDFLEPQGVSVELIDLMSIKPLDWEAIFNSVEKTGRLIVLDTGFETCSVAGEIIARVSTKKFACMQSAPIRLAMPDVPEPTSYELTKNFYIGAKEIAKAICTLLNIDLGGNIEGLDEKVPHDVPGEWFKGPF